MVTNKINIRSNYKYRLRVTNDRQPSDRWRERERERGGRGGEKRTVRKTRIPAARGRGGGPYHRTPEFDGSGLGTVDMHSTDTD